MIALLWLMHGVELMKWKDLCSSIISSARDLSKVSRHTYIGTVQSSYNFTNSRVATHFHAWLHAKSCRVPRLVAACPMPCLRMVTRKELPCATLSSCVSHAMSTRGYTQKVAVCHA